MKRCVLLAASLLTAALNAVDYDIHIDHCTVAAEEFSVSPLQGDEGHLQEAMGTLLPALIMERLSRAMERNISDEERLEDKLWPLRQERIALFMQMNNAIKERDGVVLLPLTHGARRRRLKAAEKAIKASKEALLKNMAQTDKENAQSNGGIGKEKHKAQESTPLPISIYKDDNSALWDSKINEAYDTDDKHTSAKYAAAAAAAKIDTLITGKVIVREGFISASVTVYLYPLAKAAGQVTDVGDAGSINTLAMRLADAIVPFVTNTLPSVAIFTISPQEAAKKAVLSVDDNIYKAGTDTVTMSAGLHTLTLMADGYSTASATYSFVGGKTHKVDVILQEKGEEELFVRFDGLDWNKYDKADYSALSHTVMANAVMQTPLDSEHKTTRIKIDGKAILGAVLTADAPPAQFYVPVSLTKDDAALAIKANVFDRAAYIEKRRKWFYVSYSVFITSLIGAFYTSGRYASMNGYEAEDTLNKWNTARNVTIGVSAVCGAWMVYELSRYLHAASKVLPYEAKKSHYDGDVISDDKSKEESIQVPQSDGTSTSADDASVSAPPASPKE